MTAALFAPVQLVRELLDEHPEAAWVRFHAEVDEDACHVEVCAADGTLVGVAMYAGTMPITRKPDAGV
jgi:hypothetical protein